MRKKMIVRFFLIAALLIFAGCGVGGGVNEEKISTLDSIPPIPDPTAPPIPDTDTTAPSIVYQYPSSGSTGVVINTSITAEFSEAMDPSSINGATFFLTQGMNNVSGDVSYTGTTAIFTPISNLTANTTYTATVTTGVKDLSGNSMAADSTWSFTTGSDSDTTPPTVISTTPNNGATEVALSGTTVTAIFSEYMNPASINSSTFVLTTGTTDLQGAVSYSGTTATFTPTANLPFNSAINVKISTGAKDIAGNPLSFDYTWSFNTVSVSLTWEAPTLNADGTTLTDLAGFRIYRGTSPGYYSSLIDIGIPATCQIVSGITECTYAVENLTAGTFYFSVTAYDADGNESDFSNEVSKTVN